MNNNTMNFVLWIWVVTWPYLTVQSRRHPPTHVQILFYYFLLAGMMGQHRDNSSAKDLKKIMNGEELGEGGHPSAGADNSQIIGSNVLVYTTGTRPQTFTLRFGQREHIADDRTKYYETTPIFQFECGEGTVSVLDPVDDLFMTHGVDFELVELEPKKKEKPQDDPSGYRIGWTIRWLASAKDFYTATCGMRLDEGSLKACENKKRASELFPEHVKHIRT